MGFETDQDEYTTVFCATLHLTFFAMGKGIVVSEMNVVDPIGDAQLLSHLFEPCNALPVAILFGLVALTLLLGLVLEWRNRIRQSVYDTLRRSQVCEAYVIFVFGVTRH